MDLMELNSELEALPERDLLALLVFTQWLQQNVKEFELDAMPNSFKDYGFETMRLKIIRRDDHHWGVRNRLGDILHEDGRWFKWPMPSEDVPGTQFTLPKAISAARAQLPLLRHMGMDTRELAEWVRKREAELNIKH